MAKHEEHEEHVNHEAWVIPYADLLTLLVALFVILFAISDSANAKFKENAEAISAGTGFGPTTVAVVQQSAGTGTSDVVISAGIPPIAPSGTGTQKELEAAYAAQQDLIGQAQQEQQDFTESQGQIQVAADGQGLGDLVTFRREDRGLVVTVVTDQVLFAAGSAELAAEGNGILGVIAAPLQGIPNHITVEGHTDSRPISTPRYPSNWELSTARATTVLRYLTSALNVPSSRISAAGYADTRGIADNATVEGRAQNRRVEIVINSVANDIAAATINEAAARDSAADAAAVQAISDAITEP